MTGDASASAAIPPLPPGYTLDQAPSTNTTAAVPPLPAGYSLDQAKAGGEHGYAYAPPEVKPPPADLPSFVQFDDYGRPIPGTAAANMPPGFTPPQAPPSPPPSAQPAAPPIAVGDTVVSADDADRINAPPANPPITSLTDLRDRIQQGDISALKWLAPTPDAGPIERGARYAAMVGVHGLASLAEMPINTLMGLAQGPSGAVTINPATNTLGLTPEAMTTTQMLTPGVGYGGRDVRFSGADAFKREAPSTLERAGVMKPAPVTLEELNAAINRVPAKPDDAGRGTPTERAGTASLQRRIGRFPDYRSDLRKVAGRWFVRRRNTADGHDGPRRWSRWDGRRYQREPA